MRLVHGSLAVVAAFALGVVPLPRPACAQPHDHLKCYKAKDVTSFVATIDLHPADEALFEVDAGCTVKARTKQVCFPVEQDVVASGGGAGLNVSGQDLANAFLCYTVKCPPAVPPATLQMSDPFGTRTLSGLKTSTVCTPAIVGVPTTTTTMPHGPPRQCADAAAPNCDGTCGNDNVACVEDAGACVCQFQEPFAQCGLLVGAPQCYGICLGSQSCVEIAGVCQCGDVYE
jgi:hypothetical protein